MTIEPLAKSNWPALQTQILSIEAGSYEVARRDPQEFIEKIVLHQGSVSFVTMLSTSVSGFCIAGPLEEFATVRGPDDDTTLESGLTLYAADTCVTRQFQGQGIGRQLKKAQIKKARALGYRKISGRNRVGMADTMWKLNQSFGANIIEVMDDVYKDGLTPDQSIYYHITV